ncbi:unnamed protein product, partial [Ectocarpus sp. 8 AP-2014]
MYRYSVTYRRQQQQARRKGKGTTTRGKGLQQPEEEKMSQVSSYGSDGSSPGEVPPSGISSYGYSSFGGSSAYGAEYADLLAKFEHDHTPTDVGIAWFLLVVSSGLLVVMTGVMFLLIKNR